VKFLGRTYVERLGFAPAKVYGVERALRFTSRRAMFHRRLD